MISATERQQQVWPEIFHFIVSGRQIEYRATGFEGTSFFEDSEFGLQSHAVDVVVTDMHMPGMDGQTFARALRERSPATPIVLLTSGTMPTGEAARVFAARLLKPYRQSQLFEAIARVTSVQQAIETVAQVKPPEARNQFILVADDNAVNLKVALAMLGKLGYEAATALNGREAVELVAASLRGSSAAGATRQYAAILMDANMPVMDGFAASRQIIGSHGSAALSRAAHALKGAASNVGAQALSDACFTLEQSCLQGQWPANAAQQVARLADLTDKTRQALSDWAA
ncbi:MAG: response regulator [Polaromonas sp.]